MASPRARTRRRTRRSSGATELVVVPEATLEKIRKSRCPQTVRLRLLAAACRLNALTIIQRAGSGHIGSSFSAMDVVVHLLFRELDLARRSFADPERDVYFSSKGHDVPGLYAVLNALGLIPMEDLLRLRRVDGPAGHPDRRCPMMETTTGSLGVGISKAKGMALARRITGRGGRIVVMVGDGELQEGQCWEGAQSAARLRLDNLTVLVDHNRVQSDRTVEETMPLGDVSARFEALGWYVTRCDGHDMDAIAGACRDALRIEGRPSLIIADTIKGRGVSFMEHPRALAESGGLYGWHSGTPDAERYARARDELLASIDALAKEAGVSRPARETIAPRAADGRPPARVNLVEAYGEELVRLGAEHEELVVLDADLSRDSGLEAFAGEFPERFVEIGAAEQDMVSTAGGLAHQGLLPVVNGLASFTVSRANEQIYLNACDGARVIYACHHAGLTPAEPGATHQSLRDVSLLSTTPGVLVIQPASPEEVRQALRFAVESCDESVALRLQLGPAPALEVPDGPLVPGRGTVLADGEDAVLLAYGPVMLCEALAARERLGTHGQGLRVVNMPWLNHVDVGWLAETIGKRPAVYVLEDHAPLGALADMVREAVSVLHATGHLDASWVESLGVEGLPAWGTAEEALAAHGLDAAGIATRIAADLAA